MGMLTWITSSYSGEQGQCIEVADARAAHGVVAVRDSKARGEALIFTPAAFAAFTTAAAEHSIG
ncbi:DUF397 domain-containing protein [Streptomyces murinus]